MERYTPFVGDMLQYMEAQGFPGGANGKEPVCQCET